MCMCVCVCVVCVVCCVCVRAGHTQDKTQPSCSSNGEGILLMSFDILVLLLYIMALC